MLGLHHSKTSSKAKELTATIQPGLHHTAMKWLFLASESPPPTHTHAHTHTCTHTHTLTPCTHTRIHTPPFLPPPPPPQFLTHTPIFQSVLHRFSLTKLSTQMWPLPPFISHHARCFCLSAFSESHELTIQSCTVFEIIFLNKQTSLIAPPVFLR